MGITRRAPSTKKLEEAFPGKGLKLRQLLKGETHPNEYDSVKSWVSKCLNKPSRVEQVMVAADEILEGHGTEAIFDDRGSLWPDMEYVNMGETYATTLIFDYTTDTFKIQSWGDWMGIAERRGRKYA